MEYKCLMIDIETLGFRNTSAILSISAVPFNILSGDVRVYRFNRNISLDSSLEYNLSIDESTVAWWFRQPENALIPLLKDRINLYKALEELTAFIKESKVEQVWSNSPTFDLAILRNAYKNTQLECPWEFYQERDVRTVASLVPSIKKEMKFDGTAHNAEDDCLHQIKYLTKTVQVLTSSDKPSLETLEVKPQSSPGSFVYLHEYAART